MATATGRGITQKKRGEVDASSCVPGGAAAFQKAEPREPRLREKMVTEGRRSLEIYQNQNQREGVSHFHMATSTDTSRLIDRET